MLPPYGPGILYHIISYLVGEPFDLKIRNSFWDLVCLNPVELKLPMHVEKNVLVRVVPLPNHIIVHIDVILFIFWTHG